MQFGFDGLDAAREDRFLVDAQRELGSVSADEVITALRRHMSVNAWLEDLLADINNQTEEADHLISRDCIFKWATENMGTNTSLVFYDEERAHEFVWMVPNQPSEKNKYQP